MKKNIHLYPVFIIFYILFFSHFCLSQSKNLIDSLEKLLSKTKEDTNKVNLLNQLCWQYKHSDFALAKKYSQSAYDLSEKLSFEKGIAQSLSNLGVIEEYEGNYSSALKLYFESLKQYEKINLQVGIASTLNNIGIIHDYLGKYEKALEYYEKSLAIYQKTENTNRIAGCLNNIGGIYDAMKNYEDAMKYYTLSYTAYIKFNDTIGINIVLNNMGMIYLTTKEYKKALDAFSIVAKSREIRGDKRGLLTAMINLGITYYYLENLSQSKLFSFKALALAEMLQSKEDITQLYLNLSDVYFMEKNYQKSYEYHKLYSQYKDSLFNEESSKQIAEMQTKYETEKKELQIENLNKDNAIKETEIKKQNIQKLAFASGFALMLILAFVIFRGYKQKQKANEIISAQKTEVEKQKEIVDEKNKSLEVAYKHIEEKNTEILDSIKYAKRIQEAILPPQKLVKQYLEQSFILYKPKDIVAGDFYWMEIVGNKILFASVDCTGHGVPGAFVSILGYNGLNRCVKEFGLTKPSEILDKLCELVDEAFSKSENDIKDGMDIALCCYNYKNNILEYSGAGNALYHLRENNLVEFSADKQPVGKFAYRKPFTNHEISLQKGDAIYIFTDGYADQFGGPKGKKFKYLQFEKLLLSIQNKSMEEQREILNTTIDEWRGELEQIDDICIIGVRV